MYACDLLQLQGAPSKTLKKTCAAAGRREISHIFTRARITFAHVAAVDVHVRSDLVRAAVLRGYLELLAV